MDKLSETTSFPLRFVKIATLYVITCIQAHRPWNRGQHTNAEFLRIAGERSYGSSGEKCAHGREMQKRGVRQT